jgi:cytochrome P450
VVISLTTYEECRDAFRHRALRQALYDEAAPLMHGVIVNLHGDEHRVRRRYENRLFRPDTFAWYEAEVIPGVIDEVLGEARVQGRAELLNVARNTMMTLATRIAGVDVPREAFDDFARLMERLAKGSTVTHATGDHEALLADGVEALGEVTQRFLEPSIDRRRTMVQAVQGGRGDAGALPRDVVTTLLVAAHEMNLPDEVFRREIAYFPWVGSHSTSNQLVHAMHHVFSWLEAHPHDRDALTADHVLRQRFVHESLRLHPASPVALRHATETMTLRSGRTIDVGTVRVVGSGGRQSRHDGVRSRR